MILRPIVAAEDEGGLMDGGSVEKVQVKVGDPMPEILPVGAGGSMETVGMWMIAISVIAAMVALYFIRGSWSTSSVLIIAISTFWSVGISWAVMRVGTALRWLEAIGKKHEITKG